MQTEENQTRLRRCKSVTRAEEIQKLEASLRKTQPDKPCHTPRDSLFSWSSGFSNFAGFVNWAFLLLFMGGVRLFLENLLKYGVRVDPHQWILVLTGNQEGGPEHLSPMLIIYSTVPVCFCLVLEKGLASEIISNKLGIISHVLNLMLLVLLPMIVIHIKPEGFSLMGATAVCFTYCILFLKLWSYVQVNMWCRRNKDKSPIRRQSVSLTKLSSDKTDMSNGVAIKIVEYPDNLTFKDLGYFLLAPTLCYELNFPRSSRIRKRFLIKRFLEVIIGFQVVVALFQQWIIPSVKNSLIPFSNMDIAKATERLLKLAIPNHLVWLIWFYLFFHSFLNLIGELLHFADRHFYSDWWNANNIAVFWRTWNTPVHKWAVRHLYIPLVELGYTKGTAGLAVFFISAFFHEYLVSVPLKTFKYWAFLGMMWQLPMSHLSQYMEQRFGPSVGNCLVWAGLIIGQPLCIMMYYHDYVISNFGKALLAQYGKV
ncbi:UNVERIFIED_CONTAM: hypothetical protein PYX00_006598 [Menopon gallinae]|uniref:O-acyltransferase n=1 Tax=Menopon gallinae TaxID=328185 RepID=A0AAW2HWD4_9NEOP